MTLRLQRIDDTNSGEHSFLSSDDECYYLYEYTSGAGWRGGETNQLIHNLQKKRGDGGHHYKPGAIRRCSADLSRTLSSEWLAGSVLVPVPPSKIKTDPLHDDRMSRICHGIRRPNEPDVREIIEQIRSTETFKGGNRLRPEDLRQNYRFDESALHDLPSQIGIVDDVLTTGSHFRAIKDMILDRFPKAEVTGFFVARRALPNPFADFDVEEL